MSKNRDNEAFARIVQEHGRAKGHYAGAIDGWAGPATRTAWRESIGDQPQPAPPILIKPPTPGDLPNPSGIYLLPRETPTAMTAFYGAPSKSPTNLDWFSFPYDGIRLYSRNGVLLTDRGVGDDLPDHRCHRLLVGRFEAALSEIYARLGRAEFERQGWHLYGGFHNHRKKTSGSGLSTHAWAIAVDINPDENTFARRVTTFSEVAIDIMEKWGFLSGGRAWGKDWMHFQAAIPNISAGSYYSRVGLPKNIKIAA